MSKRRTRKEKEIAAKRRISSTTTVIKEPIAPIYSVKAIDLTHKPTKSITQTKNNSESSKIGITYLMQDIRSIAAAAGLVIAFDIVLFVLLQKGFIHLPMFGY